MKRLAQSLLNSVGLYQRVKSSCAYDLYWRFANKRLLEERNEELRFYRQTLSGFKKGDVIFDIGANEGHKTDVFLRLGARVVSVDPDEQNQTVLRDRFLRHRLNPKPVTIVGKAVSDRVAVGTMWVDAPGSAKNTLNQKWVDTLRTDATRFGTALNFAQTREVQTTTLEALIEAHGMPYFVKIDVEGHEPSVLSGLKRPVPYLSFEVNLPEFRPEGLECIRLLGQISPGGEFNYSIDCRSGFAVKTWLKEREFAPIFEKCAEPSLEVFWRTPSSR